MNGDPVEYIFSHFRQDSGWNYTMDARAVAISMDRYAKIGILAAPETGNCGALGTTLASIVHHKPIPDDLTKHCKIPREVMTILDRLLEPGKNHFYQVRIIW